MDEFKPCPTCVGLKFYDGDCVKCLHDKLDAALLQIEELKKEKALVEDDLAFKTGQLLASREIVKQNDFVLTEAREHRASLTERLNESNRLVESLQNALRDVFEISEVEGAVNLTTMESAKLMAARDLVPKESERPNHEHQWDKNLLLGPGSYCRICNEVWLPTEKRNDTPQICRACEHMKASHDGHGVCFVASCSCRVFRG